MDVNKESLAQANVAFRFIVEIDNRSQGAFTECIVPTVEWEVEEVKEGGVNTYTHQLPGRRKSSRVTLKNGVGKSSLLSWYLANMKGSIERKTISITLLDITQQSVLKWNIQKAYPIKWTGPQLKSDANTIAIQTLEFACGEVTIVEQ